MNRIREHAPKSHRALIAALGFPFVWFVLYCCVGPYFPSNQPYPANNRFLHTIFLIAGIPLWLFTVALLRRARTETDGTIPRTLALALIILFGIVLCIGFLFRRFV